MDVDIVVPVWNRPVETRSCLVNLIEYSPGARFIIIDNGSERTTERMLQEFADALDDRALLLCTEVNRGTIRAVNIGLNRVEASVGAIVSNTCLVGPGWLSPILDAARQRPDAGVLVPTITPDSPPRQQKQLSSILRETSSGSLGAMAIRREVLRAIGGFDEDLDAFWCVRDFSRRAHRGGYTTLAVPTPPLSWKEETPLGSVSRREEAAQRSTAIFAERWGQSRAYCVWFPKGTAAETLLERRDILLTGARQGNRFTLLIPHGIYRELLAAGYDRLHDGIVIAPPSRFFPENAAAKTFGLLQREDPTTVAVVGVDGLSFPGVAQPLPFSSLAKGIEIVERERYNRNLPSGDGNT